MIDRVELRKEKKYRIDKKKFFLYIYSSMNKKKTSTSFVRKIIFIYFSTSARIRTGVWIKFCKIIVQ